VKSHISSRRANCCQISTATHTHPTSPHVLPAKGSEERKKKKKKILPLRVSEEKREKEKRREKYL